MGVLAFSFLLVSFAVLYRSGVVRVNSYTENATEYFCRSKIFI